MEKFKSLLVIYDSIMYLLRGFAIIFELYIIYILEVKISTKILTFSQIFPAHSIEGLNLDFRSTPINSMDVDSGIPPIDLRLDRFLARHGGLLNRRLFERSFLLTGAI